MRAIVLERFGPPDVLRPRRNGRRQRRRGWAGRLRGRPLDCAEVAAETEAAGARTTWSAADLSSRDECHRLVAETVERFGRVDALIHSAGIVDGHPIAEITEEELLRTLAINLGAAVWLTQAIIPAMRAKGYRRIVLTISGHGLFPIDPPALPAHAVGKAAQFGLMNTLATEIAVDGILINALAPVAATRVCTRVPILIASRPTSPRPLSRSSPQSFARTSGSCFGPREASSRSVATP